VTEWLSGLLMGLAMGLTWGYETHKWVARKRRQAEVPYRFICFQCRNEGVRFELASNDLAALDGLALEHKRRLH
jgi:hypothetical protein